ncbi:MAG: DsbC family protein [Gammaproteobacteria bacterium]
MKVFSGYAVMALLLLSSFAASADEAQITQALAKSMPSLKVDSVSPSEIKGLYQVVVGANIFYASEDGKYLVQGKIFDLAERKDITEAKLADARIKAILKLGEDKMINFPAKIKKHNVYVFTDIDCGYCRKFHSEIDKYLAEGISVHYIFFPRAGKDSDSYKKAVAVWCAKDRNAALTAAKKGNDPKAVNCDNPVDQQMALGVEVGVRGTPMIVTEKGVTFPGYLPPKQLAEALQFDTADIIN